MSDNHRWGDSGQPLPAVTPDMSGEPKGTLLVELHGELALHPWRDPATLPEDPYGLFIQRSEAMGWSTGAVAGSAGLWDTHEAGPELPGSGPASAPAAWFQVGVDTVPAERPLPVQPFLRCAGDVMAWYGTLELQAMQVLLPVEKLVSPSAVVSPSLHTADWFAAPAPQAPTPVRVTLDSGPEPSIPAAAPDMFGWIGRLNQDVFACDSYSLTDHDPLAGQTLLNEWLSHDSLFNRATFRGTLAEWSLDALGWLGGLLAEASVRHGVTTPVLLTTSRDR